jgi:hypothetical protein
MQLPNGIKRALIVVSVAWMVSFYIARKDAIDFSLIVGGSTPRTMCEDVYAHGDKELRECQGAGPGGWVEDSLRIEKGEKTPFDYYQQEHHDFSVWYWLFGVPLALTLLAYAWLWVRAGFAEDRNTGRPRS